MINFVYALQSFGSDLSRLDLSPETVADVQVNGGAAAVVVIGDGLLGATVTPQPGGTARSRFAVQGAVFVPVDIADTHTGLLLEVSGGTIREAYFGLRGSMQGWLTRASRLPTGGAMVAPEITAHHSVSGRLLGISTAPAAEHVTLAMTGIPADDMHSDGEALRTGLAAGRVAFAVESPTDVPTFLAWAEGELNRPKARTGNQYDWTLNLRVAS